MPPRIVSEKAGETPPVSRQHRVGLQRSQKVQQILLLAGTEVIEICHHCVGFAALACVCPDCLDQVGGAAIMQQEDSLSQSPQRSRAELVAACAALGNVVGQPGTHVMELKVRVRVHLDIAQRRNKIRWLRST